MARLGDICEKVTDYVASGSFAALKENVLITNEENYAIMVKTADFSNGFTKGLTYTDKHGYDFLRNSNLFGGELILSNIGSIGKVFKVPYLDCPMTLASNTVMIKTATPELTDYLYYYFLSPAGYKKLLSISSGTSMLKFNKTELKKLEVPVPNVDRQRHIIAVMDKVTELIAIRKEQLAKLDQLVKSRFIELFGDPETNPCKWSISKLSEFCDLQNGYAFKSQDYLDNSTVLNCRMSNIRPDGGFDAEYHPKYLPDTFWEKYKEYRLVDGDVIIAMTDMASDPKILGVPTIVRTNGKKFLLNQRVGKLTFYDNKTINNVYLMFVLSQKHIRQQLVKSAGGSTQINVGKPAVLAAEFFVPPMELQSQFAAFVEQTDKSKLAIQQSLDKLELLKKSLMQEYFG